MLRVGGGCQRLGGRWRVQPAFGFAFERRRTQWWGDRALREWLVAKSSLFVLFVISGDVQNVERRGSGREEDM